VTEAIQAEAEHGVHRNFYIALVDPVLDGLGRDHKFDTPILCHARLPILTRIRPSGNRCFVNMRRKLSNLTLTMYGVPRGGVDEAFTIGIKFDWPVSIHSKPAAGSQTTASLPNAQCFGMRRTTLTQ